MTPARQAEMITELQRVLSSYRCDKIYPTRPSYRRCKKCQWCLVAAFLAALTVPATAGSVSFHDARGNYAGASITRNGHSTFTDSGGRYVGSSSTRGNTTTVYDRNGNRAGTLTRTGR